MISFNSYNLESAYLLVNRINGSDAPVRELQSETLAYQDGFSVVANHWRSRTITIGGMLDATSSDHLLTMLDTLKYNLQGVGKNLDVSYGTGTRRYKATLSRFEAPEDFYNITHLPYTAEFICQPFGYGTSAVNFSSNSVTSSPRSETVTITGSYCPKPVITIYFNSVTSATAVTITNSTTATAVTITKNISAYDSLVINTEFMTVTVNGTQVDFSGAIPEFIPGDNTLTINVASTARNYDLDVDYTPRYL